MVEDGALDSEWRAVRTDRGSSRMSHPTSLGPYPLNWKRNNCNFLEVLRRVKVSLKEKAKPEAGLCPASEAPGVKCGEHRQRAQGYWNGSEKTKCLAKGQGRMREPQ